jgi:hypothetical protein
MNNIQKYSDKTFEDIKHINEYGAEYWQARELAPVLEYTQWRNFFSVVEKAVEACANSGFNVDDHFADVSKMVDIAKVDWRFNVAVHRDMEQALDDLIWDFTEEYEIKLPVEKIDLILEGLMRTAVSRY